MPRSTFTSPVPTNIDIVGIPPSTTNGIQPILVQGIMPDHFTIRLLGTLFDTAADPVIVSPLIYGAIFYVKNEQATDVKVVGVAAGDPGVIVLAGQTFLLGTDGDDRVIFISAGSGGTSGTPSVLNKNMVAATTLVDNDLATPTAIAATPIGYVEIQVNGVSVTVGNGTKISVSSYFSGDGGVTARATSAIIAGDLLYWNGSVAGFQLDAATDTLNFLYEA